MHKGDRSMNLVDEAFEKAKEVVRLNVTERGFSACSIQHEEPYRYFCGHALEEKLDFSFFVGRQVVGFSSSSPSLPESRSIKRVNCVSDAVQSRSSACLRSSGSLI